MKENRDMKRLNMANAAVQANLIALINRDCLLNIDNHVNNNNDTNTDPEKEKRKQKNLISLAIKTGKLSKDLFNKKRCIIDKNTSTRYALHQHNTILKSFSMGEDISSIDSISDNIYTCKFSNILDLTLPSSFILIWHLTLLLQFR